MDTIRLQIASQLNAEISQLIKEKYPQFDFDYVRHISYFGGIFPQTNLELIKSTIAEISKNLNSFNVELGSLIYDKGYLLWPTVGKQSLNLKSIHSLIVEKLNPLRNGLLREKFLDNDYLKTLPIEQRELAIKYGSQFVKEYYLPHVTLSKTNVDRLPDDYLKGTKLIIDNITIFEAISEGRCTKELYKIIF